MTNLIIDPEFSALIPPLDPEERAGLEADLVRDGCLDALKVWGDPAILLDGHNRYEICQRREIPFRVERVDVKDRTAAAVWIIDHQLNRRNLPAWARLELSDKKTEYYAEESKERQRIRKGEQPGADDTTTQTFAQLPEDRNERTVNARVAKDAGVSRETVLE